MRKAEDIFEKHWTLATGKSIDDTTLSHMKYCVNAIEEAQKEAYNEVIMDARANRPIKDDSWCISGSRNLYYVSSESILALLKP